MNALSGSASLALAALAICSCSDGDTPAPVVPTFKPALMIQMAPGTPTELFDTVLATAATPFTVQVKRVLNSQGEMEPARGVSVSWRISGWPADRPPTSTIVEAIRLTSTSVTDTAGMAQATVTFGSVAGGYGVEAVVSGGSAVRFRATALHGAPARVVITKGDGQLGLVGTGLPGEYAVGVTDTYGNPAGGDIEWRVATGGGSLAEPPCDPEYDYCPHSGVIHVLGPVDGPQAVTATATALPGKPKATFTATGVTAIVHAGEGSLCYIGFDPDTASIPPGTTVAWRWCNVDYSLTHNVTFEDGQGSSPTQMEGWHTRKFSAVGTYRYRCTLHSTSFTEGEVGAVTVK